MRHAILICAVLVSACGARPPATTAASPTAASPTAGSTVAAVPTNAAGDQDPTGDRTRSAGGDVPVVLTGVPVVHGVGDVEWCAAGPREGGCAGIVVTRLSAEERALVDDTDGLWSVAGIYDGRRLTATGAPERARVERADRFPTLCDDVRGEPGPGGNPDSAATDAIVGYTATIPDRFAGMWWDSTTAVMNVLLTGDDVERHREALEEAVGDRGAVCVVGGARYSERELRTAQERAGAIAAEAGLGPWSSGVDTVANRVELLVERSDAPTRRRIREETGGAVEVHAYLSLRGDVTIDDLPQPPDRGDIPLETADTRAGGGMDALGRFTVRYDEQRNCLYTGSDDERTGLKWPFGYYALSDPIRVFDADGELVARVGDRLDSGGGTIARSGRSRCGTDHVWVMSGRPTIVQATEAPTAGQ